jgi:hypothetical protein
MQKGQKPSKHVFIKIFIRKKKCKPADRVDINWNIKQFPDEYKYLITCDKLDPTSNIYVYGPSTTAN